MRRNRALILRRLARGKLARAVLDERLLRQVRVSDAGIRLHSVSWEDYWSDVPASVAPALEQIREAWRGVVSGNGDARATERYPDLYQELLCQAHALASTKAPHAREFLRRLTSFETFELVRENDPIGHCAATFSSRHPLLATQSIRRVPGGRPLRSLPIISLYATNRAELFSYYRQHSLPTGFPSSLLLYLPVGNESRVPAYETLRAVAPLLSDGADPFARERARRIWNGVIEPALRCFELGVASLQAIEVVDIGMGNGDLTSNLAGQVALVRRQLGMPPARFHVWGIDLDPGTLGRSRGSAATYSYVERAEYRAWLDLPDRQLPDIPAGSVRLGLISKVFDALTRVSVCPAALDDNRTDDLLSGAQEDRMGSYLCATAEAAECHEPHSRESTCRVQRIPAAEAADTSSGRSVIEAMAQRCDIVVIEDPDFGPEQLRDHCRRHSLDSIVAFDLHSRLSLVASHCLLLARSNRLRSNPAGVRIW